MFAPNKEKKTLTQVRLLEAAVLLFSRRGFNGTGTREIAQLADINESTLFRHYPTKKDLFWAALESRLTRLKFDRELQSALGGEDHPEAVLPMIFEFLVATVCEQPELIRLLCVSALELPGGDKIYQKHLGAIFDCISSYVANCVRRGVICEIDAHTLTFAFAGTVIANMSLYQLFVGHALPFASMRDTAAAYSEFWLRVLGAGSPLWSYPPLNTPVIAE